MKNLKSSPADMTTQPLDQTSAPSISFNPQQQTANNNWLKQKFHSLSIRQQIALGYTVTMAIAVLGTTTGLAIGHQYQKPAYERMILAHQQERLLTNLHIAPLEIPFYGYKLKYSQNKTPEEFEGEKSLWLAEIQEIQEHLSELESHYDHLSEIHPSLNQSNGVIEAYHRELELLVQQIKPLGLKTEELTTAQKLLRNFLEKPAVQEFNRLSDNARRLILTIHATEVDAAVSLERAKTVSQQIIFSSLLVSVLLATGLAIYTSRAISRPVEEVTKIAQRVTNESNFQLQVPVTKNDEIGHLAISFNQLILSINKILEQLETEQQLKLSQSEKMASLGKMLAGIAHELNNPINFIYGNIAPAKEYIEDIFSLLETYASEIPQPPDAVAELKESIDIDFLQEDLMKIIQSMQLGAERARSIILNLKNFYRLDDNLANPINLHQCIDSTLIMLNNRIKKGIKVVKNYGKIPEIESYMGLLYQVFMNLIANAIDALEEESEYNQDPKIIITTEMFDPEYVIVKIYDNGKGIKSENQEKIFQTFFTTKPRGVGTGLGLAITRKIVEEKHGGKLNCHSEIDQGTEFSIVLPIKHEMPEKSEETIFAN